MSIQIGIVQSEKDEQSLVEFLLKREPLLAMSRWFPSNTFEPKRLGQDTAPEQIIFREADIGLVRDSLIPAPGAVGIVTVPINAGLGIEWTRTIHYAESGFSNGRFYLSWAAPLWRISSI